MRLLFAAAIVLLVAAPVRAQAPALERVGGDMKALLKDLKGRAAETPAVRAESVTGIYPETDCKTVELAEGAGTVSEPLRLETRTWIEECIYIPTPPGGGTCIPQRRLLSWDEATVRVSIAERAQAAPKERFRACMTGRWLSLKVLESPFKYDIKEKDGTFTLTRK